MNTKEIGVVVLFVGVVFFIAGATFLLDKALMVAGNILLIVGILFLIKTKTIYIFSYEKIQGILLFLFGFFILFFKYVFIGFLFESVGIFYLFYDKIPTFKGILRGVVYRLFRMCLIRYMRDMKGFIDYSGIRGRDMSSEVLDYLSRLFMYVSWGIKIIECV
ncbi:hypothetical protein CWI38_0346p0050 [Hamiltosporidium tvaerminnensis]|uniref:Uncharacterized protein n=2 Tax=Hamiltosporidium TaxID=1176354 RepID=A0A4Q9LXA4_9MICR|nr:hypothetical protein CWI38_0437p0020 [Hamiltosporidium tvaerminnensis]TBU13492.1 hypothetical protein CWI38_0415p0040 [Hamiltosporidium tvaerminnensis]TBU13750.1 hypothetical protein CWI38_0346p0050 [Hamiltosporidium tvaerminnensis]